MEKDRYDAGVPSWVDLACPDPAGAARFYRGLFGWEVETGPPEAGGYAIAQLRGRPVAGLSPQPQPGPAAWATYVAVDDVDATSGTVVANGGQVVVPPLDVMDQGRMAVFTDPVGASIAVWQAGAFLGAGVVNEAGSLSWNELVTDDLDTAARFYGAVFGWRAVPTDGYTTFELGGAPVAGMLPRPAMIPPGTPSFWGVYFAVDDVEAAVARVGELGGSVVVAPTSIGQGRFAVVADTAGVVFDVMELATPSGG